MGKEAKEACTAPWHLRKKRNLGINRATICSQRGSWVMGIEFQAGLIYLNKIAKNMNPPRLYMISLNLNLTRVSFTIKLNI